MGAGWHLAKLSLRVVWSDGSLSALVVLGGIASGAVALAAPRRSASSFAVFGTVPAVLLLFFGLASGSTPVAVVCVVVGILGAVVAGVLGSAARSVFSVALYRYASGAGPTGPFTAADLESAVARRG